MLCGYAIMLYVVMSSFLERLTFMNMGRCRQRFVEMAPGGATQVDIIRRNAAQSHWLDQQPRPALAPRDGSCGIVQGVVLVEFECATFLRGSLERWPLVRLCVAVVLTARLARELLFGQ
ncbi:MAG: hypothetical protein ACC652_08340, partial [Acidimicrobiales bacterium]